MRSDRRVEQDAPLSERKTAIGQERTVGLSHSQGMATRVHGEGQIALAQAPACLSQNLNLS
jgi:hypothetical protein